MELQSKKPSQTETMPLTSSINTSYETQEDTLSISSNSQTHGESLDAKHSTPRQIDSAENESSYPLLGRDIESVDRDSHVRGEASVNEEKIAARPTINPDFFKEEITNLKSAGLTLEKRRGFRNDERRKQAFVLNGLTAAAGVLFGIIINNPSYNKDSDLIAAATLTGALQTLVGILTYDRLATDIFRLSTHSVWILKKCGLSPNNDETADAYKRRLLTALRTPEFQEICKRVAAQAEVLKLLTPKLDEKEAKKWSLPSRHKSEIAGITASKLFEPQLTRFFLSLSGIERPKPVTVPLEPEEEQRLEADNNSNLSPS